MWHDTGLVNGGKFMSGTNKLGTFCTIFNASNWTQYQAEVREMLLPSQELGKVEFPADPKGYPCLVASNHKPVDATKANQFTYFSVECCFVYLNDAHRLMDAAASVDDSIIVEDLNDSRDFGFPRGVQGRRKSDFLGEDDFDESAGQSESDLTILVLGMLKELHDIGALKFDRLIATLPSVQSALESHTAKVEDPPEGMLELLTALWGEINAN